MEIFGSHRVNGTFRDLRKKGGRLMEKWVGHAKSAVTTNWTKVIRRPYGICKQTSFLQGNW
jgi:hypothetical protein